MNHKYPGLYLYFDWLEGIEAMGAEDGFRLVMNLYHFAKEGAEPAPLEGSFNIIQNICLAQMKRSKLQSEAGKLGAAKAEEMKRFKKERLSSAKTRVMRMREEGYYVDPQDDEEELAFMQAILHGEGDPVIPPRTPPFDSFYPAD